MGQISQTHSVDKTHPSVCLFNYQSIRSPVHLFIYLPPTQPPPPTYLPIYLLNYLYIYLSIYITIFHRSNKPSSINQCVYLLSTYLSVCLCIYLPMYSSICLHINQSMYLFLSLCPSPPPPPSFSFPPPPPKTPFCLFFLLFFIKKL